MNRGLFNAQLNEIQKVLNKLKIFKERVYFPNYTSYASLFFRKINYSEVWHFCFKEQLYDFLLNSDSILQFRYENNTVMKLSYVFLECPIQPKQSFDDFYDIKIAAGEDDEQRILREYDFYIANLEFKESITPIRYDFNPEIYVAGRHPAYHIHIGHSNDIRVGTKSILRPISFLLFIIRQCFPDQWDRIMDIQNAEHLLKNVREHLNEIQAHLWCSIDENEMIMV